MSQKIGSDIVSTSKNNAVNLSTLVKCFKVSSDIYFKVAQFFPDFLELYTGCCAITYSNSVLHNLIEYLKYYKAHLKKLTSINELMIVLEEHNISYDERYFE